VHLEGSVRAGTLRGIAHVGAPEFTPPSYQADAIGSGRTQEGHG
jgi:hypothetical protein